MTNTGQVAGNVLKAPVSICKSHKILSSLPVFFVSLSCRLQRELQHLAAAEQTSKTTLYAVFIVKPVFCHCLPSLLSSLSLSSPLSLSFTVAQDESASMCPCSSSLSGAPRWSSSSFSNWAPTAGWNYSSPPKLSPLFLNKCGCSNRGVLLIHLYRAVCVECAVLFTEPDREPNKPHSRCKDTTCRMRRNVLDLWHWFGVVVSEKVAKSANADSPSIQATPPKLSL